MLLRSNKNRQIPKNREYVFFYNHWFSNHSSNLSMFLNQKKIDTALFKLIMMQSKIYIVFIFHNKVWDAQINLFIYGCLYVRNK